MRRSASLQSCSAASAIFSMAESACFNPRFRAENRRYTKPRFDALRSLAPMVRQVYARMVKRSGGVSEANKMLRETVDRVTRGDLNLAADEDELQRFCDRKALQCERLMYRRGVEVVAEFLSFYGIDPPIKPGTKGELCNKRPACKKWWLRQVRTMAGRECEQMCREAGQVSKQAGVYVSNHTLRRWVMAQARNKSLLDALEAENDTGEVFTLSELAALGQANPAIRRGELMVRMRGFEDWAERSEEEWASVFITLTCPSKYHERLSNGKKNPKSIGATPRDAQRYLCGVWSRFRAKADRRGYGYFGFRIAEPHHDGTPHWHLLLFVRRHDLDAFNSAFREEGLRVDGKEPGAERHRFTVVEIDPEKGTAAGYIAKYVAKNIDGVAVGLDEEAGIDACITAAKVRAWASTWAIRQFQQISGPPVGVFRELRRAANHPETLPVITEQCELQFEAAREAADKGDWAEYTEQNGGAVCRRAERPIQVYKWEKSDPGRYGDKVKEIKGLWCWWFCFPIVTRVRQWKVRFKEAVADLNAKREKFFSDPPQAVGLGLV